MSSRFGSMGVNTCTNPVESYDLSRGLVSRCVGNDEDSGDMKKKGRDDHRGNEKRQIRR